MKENFLFKKTMEDIAEYSEAIELLRKMATDLGLNPDKLNHHNLITRCVKVLKDTAGFEAKAKELGYSSLGNALKALSMMTERPGKWDISVLPEVFHKLPRIWLEGRVENKRKEIEGAAPMTVRAAERRHRTMMPLILDAWALVNGDKEEIEALVYNYQSGTPNEYERFLYDLIHDLEPIPEEEEFKNLTMPSKVIDPDVEAMVAVVAMEHDEGTVSPLFLKQTAIARLNRQKRIRR